jgi:CrcB protein
MVIRLLCIALGGALGALSRYWVTEWISRLTSFAAFPFGTVVVNVVGSLILGLVLGLATSERIALDASTRALVVVGFLGAFTTISTFSYETVEALRVGAPHIAFLNVVISVLFGLAACGLGLWLGGRW